MSSVDPSKFKFSTLFGYLLNYNYNDGTTYSVSVPAKTYSSLEVTNHTLSVPVGDVRDLSQIRVNFSFDSDKWYMFPIGGDLVFGSVFSVPVVGAYSSGNFVLTVFVVNQSPDSQSMPGFTVTVKPLLFVQPV